MRYFKRLLGLDGASSRRNETRLLPKPLRDFFQIADTAIRSGSVDAIVQAVDQLRPYTTADQGDEAAAFWKMIVEAAAKLSKHRRRTGHVRSLWGVTPIVTLRYGAQADRRMGVEADTLVFGTYYITRDFDIDLGPAQNHIIERNPGNLSVFRHLVLAWALLRYDIFHLYNDRGLIEPAGGYGSDRFGIALPELEIYGRAEKALFTYAYGADHRMRNKTLSLAPLNFCMDCPEPGKFCVCDDEGGERMLATIKRHATRMIGFGLSMDLLPDARFMNYIVVDPDELAPREYVPQIETLRVGHFPNHGYFKGTKYLEEAIETLRAAGRPIELVRFSGLPREQILDAVSKVDVVVDQLISGAFGLTAVEAMALGRPVIAHLREGLLIAAPEECPVIPARPDTIAQLLDRLIDDRTPLEEAGRRGVDYVRRHCSVDSLAESLADLYVECIQPRSVFTRRLPFWRRRMQREARSRDIASQAIKLSFIQRVKRSLSARWDNLACVAHERGASLAPFVAADRVVRKVYRSLLMAAQLSRSTGRFRAALRHRAVRYADSAATHMIERRVAKARRTTQQRLKAGTVRSLWGVTPILTLPLKSAADKALGFQSKTFVYQTYHITRDFDIRLERYFIFIIKNFPDFLRPFEKFVLLALLTRYDVFNFFFDRGILSPEERFGINRYELDVLKRAGKRVYVYAYGADVRLRRQTLALRRWTFCTECPEPGLFCLCDDEVGSRTIARISEYATGTVALGDMVPYVPGCRVLHYWPIDVRKILPANNGPRDTAQALRVAHAPNHTHFKGSHYLEAAIERLRAKGHLIDYVKVQGVSNSEVIRLFGEADLIADQFLGGGLGYTALEAMARAKPVLSYVPGPEFVEAPQDCPVINTNPDTLGDVLLWVLENREILPAIGAQGRVYIEKWHSVEAVAERFGAMYEQSAEFPADILERIAHFRHQVEKTRSTMQNAIGWEHPFLVMERSTP